MVGIYMFRNRINGMSYIGQSVDIDRRIKEHRTRKSELSTFHKAIYEYGIDAFDITILEECDIECLNDREVFYIAKYNTIYPNGYNISSGGNFGCCVNKLSSFSDVVQIRNLLSTTSLSNSEIGAIYNISDQMVSDINRGRSWFDDKISYPIRERKRKEFKCSCCGAVQKWESESGLCRKCYIEKDSTNHAKSKISKEELYKLLCNHSFTEVANKYSVTCNSVRKWCDSFGIPRHASYYKNLKSISVKTQ